MAACETPVAVESCAECCAFEKVADADGSEGVIVSFMLDRGSNVVLFKDEAISQMAVVESNVPEDVVGVWQASASSIGRTLRARFLLGSHVIELSGGEAPTARRNIISESVLWDLLGWTVLGEPYMYIQTHQGSRLPITRVNGLYFVKATLLKMGSTPSTAEASVLEVAATASLRRLGKAAVARLWGARLHLNCDGLRAMTQTTGGSGLDAIDRVMIDAVENDNVRLRSSQRRAPVEQATPSDHTASKPGERLLLDCYGKIEAASVTTGAQFVLEACCQVTAFGYEAPSRRHTLKIWIGFVQHVLVAERALGHEPMYLRWDRAPELDDHNQIEMKSNLEMEFNLVVEFGAAGHHESIGAMEKRCDTTTRMAESFLMRCEKPQSYLADAKVYAGMILNTKPASKRSMSRAEHHGLPRPDFARRVPYLFGCEASILEDEVARGPKGAGFAPQSTTKGRTSVGTFVGWSGSSYLVKLHRGATVTRTSITVLNEHVLARRGMPSGEMGVDAGTQTADDDLQQTEQQQSAFPAPTAYEVDAPEGEVGPPSVRTRAVTWSQVVRAPAQQAAPKPSPAHPQRPPDLDIVGQRIEVDWPKHGGFFGGRVTDYRTSPSDGVQAYRVVYDNADGKYKQSDVDMWHVLDPGRTRPGCGVASRVPRRRQQRRRSDVASRARRRPRRRAWRRSSERLRRARLENCSTCSTRRSTNSARRLRTCAMSRASSSCRALGSAWSWASDM